MSARGEKSSGAKIFPPPAPGTHVIKSWPVYYRQSAAGTKPFEVRRNDRDYRPGDRVVMFEWDPEKAETRGREADGYSGRFLRGEVTRVTSGFGLQDGYVVLGMRWDHSRGDSR